MIASSRVWSWIRWSLLGSGLPLLWACGSHPLVAPTPDPTRVTQNVFTASLVNKLDVVFMVDNSPSMQPVQQRLVAQFPSFMTPLKAVPTPDSSGVALPDIHVGVISSDTGPGKFQDTANCHFGGDNGQFQFRARGTCTQSPLHTTPTQQTFLSASANQTVTNYDGDISDAFGCIAALGDKGCGFEGQLKSVRWSLDPVNPPGGNEGFLREDATLAVVLITNEDDCSVPDDSDLADPTQTHMADPLGPFQSYRCNEFGHLCSINGTLQPPPRNAAANHLQGCISNEIQTPTPTAPHGLLTRVADEVAFLKGLKSDPKRIVVAAITGLPADYSVKMVSDTIPELHPNVVPSCTSKSGDTADPAVRLQQWVNAFGDHGLATSICDDTLNSALNAIAKLIIVNLGPQCITGTLRDGDPTTPELDPICQVMDVYTDAQKQQHQRVLHACAVDPSPPCWALVDDQKKCSGAKKLEVTRDGGTLPDDLEINISCSLCIPGVSRPGCP
jgi:hypothetical protein